MQGLSLGAEAAYRIRDTGPAWRGGRTQRRGIGRSPYVVIAGPATVGSCQEIVAVRRRGEGGERRVVNSKASGSSLRSEPGVGRT